MSEPLRILAVSDTHFVRSARVEAGPGNRLAVEWVMRAVEQAKREGPLDAIVLLGDLVADGSAHGADLDLAEMAAALRGAKLPVIAVPGNHDPEPEKFFQILGDAPGVHRVKGYVLYSFADRYAADDTMTRPTEALDCFLAETAGAPAIVLQHSPIHPDVQDSRYPYMPLNAGEIISAYERGHVILSLSGHYHPGQSHSMRNEVAYLTCPALKETPFRFHLIEVTGREARVETRQLRVERSGMVDTHIHTHFGYCAVDVHPQPALERLDLLGIAGCAMVEHAGQLYLTPDEFWKALHINDPERLRRARDAGADRIAAFRAAMQEFRSERVRVGLEVEVDANGDLTLLEEDRADWDILLGAVHWLPENALSDTPKRFTQAFLEAVEHLLDGGVHVLAHPFRIFAQRRIPTSKGLYWSVAKMLAERDVAAEINFHYNAPDVEFFRICAAEGVRIVTGSDSHLLREVGDLAPHARMLSEICPGTASHDR